MTYRTTLDRFRLGGWGTSCDHAWADERLSIGPMRARLSSSVATVVAAVSMGAVLGAPGPVAEQTVAGVVSAAAARPTDGDAPVTVSAPATERADGLRDRLASIRVAASRDRAAASLRVWPAEGLHTGWWGEWRGGRAHSGIDIDGQTGDPVVAAARGVVVHAGQAPQGYGGYGLMVIIDHEGFSTLYAHLSRIDVTPSQAVEAGDLIGAIGTTGSVTGSHLHFETRIGGIPVDPAPFMPAKVKPPQVESTVPPLRQYIPASRVM